MMTEKYICFQMLKENPFFFIFFFLLFSFIAKAKGPLRQLQSSQYAISNDRSSQMLEQCRNVNRDGLYEKYWNSGQTPYSSSFGSTFALDETVFNEFLQLNIAGINSLLKANTWGYTTYIAMALVGLAIMVISAPIMCVLLFCPMDSCLRKKLIYSKIEEIWPAILTFLVGAGVIACCSVGMLSGYNLYQGYQQTSCSGTVIFDDAINGNINADKTGFFAGTTTIATQLTKFGKNSAQIFNNLSHLSSEQPYYSNSIDLMTQSMQNIYQIPSTSGGTLTLKYNTPLMSSAATGQVDSTFPSILGTKDTSGSLVKQAYDGVQSGQTSIKSMANNVDVLMASQYTYWNYTEIVIQEANKTTDSLFQSILLINDIFNTFPLSSGLQNIELIVYGTIAGITCLLLVSMLCFMKWNMIGCRYCLYFFGFILFFACLGAFGLWLFFGFSSAVAYSGCNYFDSSVSTPAAFANSLQKLGADPSVARELSVCLNGQSGDFIGALAGSTSSLYLQNWTTTMNNLNSFSGEKISSDITAAYTPLNSQVSAYASSQILDLSDSSSISDLTYVSASKNYPTCSQGNFQGDSWIPHLNLQNNLIPCLSPQPQQSVDNLTCSSQSAFLTASSGCTGCIGTYSMLYYSNSYSEAFSYLNSRYSDCSQFNSDLSNIWANYYLVKKNTLEPLLSRQSTASQSVSSVKDNLITNVGPLVSNTVNSLYTSSGSILNPHFGLLGGLNCNVIGEDLLVFKAAACRNTFSYSYFHRMIMMILACCLAVLLCCNTCVLFRKKKGIYNSINFPTDDNEDGKARVQAQASPLTDDRLRYRYY